MQIAIYLILVLSLLNEFIPIPFMELNQFAILVSIPAIVWTKITTKEHVLSLKSNQAMLFFLFFSILIGFVAGTGLMQTIDRDSYFKAIKNLTINFMFFYMMAILPHSLYNKIIRSLAYMAATLFIIEYFLYKLSSVGYTLLFSEPYGGIRHMANFLSPNSYAIVIVFVIVWLVAEALQTNKKFLLIVAALLILPLLSTSSKSGLLILVLGVGYIFYFSLKSRKAKLAVITLAGFLILFLSNGLVRILNQFTDNYFVRRIVMYLEEGSLFGVRSDFYGDMFELFKQNWFTGIGYGNITGENTFISSISSPHNEYLRFFLEGGAVAGLLFILCMGLLVYQCVDILRKSPENKQYIHRYVCFVFLFLICEIFYNYFNAQRESVIMLAFTAGIFTFGKSESRKVRE